MLVEAAMTTDLVTCSVEESVRGGVERMLRNHAGSVIVHEDAAPVGIVTETDCLHAGFVTEAPFGEIPIRKVMSRPLHTIPPEKTLRRATKRMREKSIKKLVVVEGMDLVGIITTQDVIEAYHDLKAEIHDIVKADRAWPLETRRPGPNTR
ncbi:inosine-5-monophosphate dehydrogenase [Halobellus salinus]|uniref:Inosine-5-monophosphate dehydrogenase n=1 Tax=Halobellus salinus TaxID=931585 RepID=A0A830ES15_9EURY|nr:CBS domain-containing protein [Halobellus salinus]GGJ16097.1 inosine-5-monophosphate dehydrogenase [Halobellus salinus]SMP31392.1 CBS domain-containing protein [Halobellus salinus]